MNNSWLVVIDDFFTEEENNHILDLAYKDSFPFKIIAKDYRIPFYTKDPNLHPFITKMITSCYSDDYDGYEVWVNFKAIGLHYDYDVVLFHETGRVVHPSLSIVYYPKVKIIGGGGGFVIEKEAIIEAKDKRLIAFNSNLQHGVSTYQGERISLAVNVWKKQPTLKET